MKKLFKKFVLSSIILLMICFISSVLTTSAEAAPKKKAKGGLNQEQLDTMNKDLNVLTKKIYANSLFSPKDNETMINIKLDLDNAMLKAV